MEVNYKKDRGWAWVVLAAAFFSSLLISVSLASVALYYEHLADYFNVGMGDVGWLATLLEFTYSCGGVLFDGTVRRWGFQKATIIGSFILCIGFVVNGIFPYLLVLYISFAVLIGVGLGICQFSLTVAAQNSFDKHKAIAGGVPSIGDGVGETLSPIIIYNLIDAYTWRGAMFVHGSIMLNLAVAGALIIPRVPRKHKKNKRTKLCSWTNSSIWKLFQEPILVIYCLGYFLTRSGISGFTIHTPNRASYLGIQKENIVWIFSAIGFTNIFSRILWTFAANCSCVNRFYMSGINIIITGMIILVSCAASNFLQLLIISVTFSIFRGTIAVTRITLLVDLVGIDKLPAAYVLFRLFAGFASISAPIMGWLYEWLESYLGAYAFAAGLEILGGIMILCVPFMRHISSRFSKKKKPMKPRTPTIISVKSTSDSDEDESITRTRSATVTAP